MKAKTQRLGTTLSAIALCPVPSFAGGLYLYELGTADTGLAGAGMAARAEDAATVYNNPAGMTRLAGNQLAVGGQVLYGQAERAFATQAKDGDAGKVDGWLPGGSLFYSHSISDRLKLGLATYGNFGLAEDFSASVAGQKLRYKVALMALTIQPTIAYRLDERWSIGAGLQASYGYLRLKREAFLDAEASRASDRDWAYGGRFGVLYEPTKDTRFGLVYNSRADLSFNANTTESELLPESTRRRPFGAEITMPQQVIGSVFHRLDERWTMMGNVGWQNWSQFSNAALESSVGTTTSSLQFRDTWHFAYGVQYQLDPDTTLNGGVAYDSSMYKKGSTTSFSWPCGDAWRFGAGLQHALSGNEDIGFSAEYLYADGNADASKPVRGSYDNVQMFFVSVNYTYRF